MSGDNLPPAELDIGYFRGDERRGEITPRSIENKLVAWQLDQNYYDGARENGYGGFRDDGRWLDLVPKLIQHFSIPENGTIVDLGCKKGFILKAFKALLPQGRFIGIENHPYPIGIADDNIKQHLTQGDLFEIPCEDNSVDFLIAFSSIYMQNLGDVVKSLKEIMRVAAGRSYITVGAFRNEAEREIFQRWTLLGTTILSIEDWHAVFRHAGYTGSVFYTTPAALGFSSSK